MKELSLRKMVADKVSWSAAEIRNRLPGYETQKILVQSNEFVLIHYITYKGCFGGLLSVDSFIIEELGTKDRKSFSTLNEAVKFWEKLVG
jgi:hypothetical protein